MTVHTVEGKNEPLVDTIASEKLERRVTCTGEGRVRLITRRKDGPIVIISTGTGRNSRAISDGETGTARKIFDETRQVNCSIPSFVGPLCVLMDLTL